VTVPSKRDLIRKQAVKPKPKPSTPNLKATIGKYLQRNVFLEEQLQKKELVVRAIATM
jgi:hypothetical protein